MAEERIEMDPTLESVLRYCLKDARERMEKGEGIVPFTALAVGETLFMEEHDGNEPAEAFKSARHTVAGARGAQAYGFCYDGFVEAEGPLGDGVKKRDCVIAEGGTPGADYGHAIGQLYTVQEDGTAKFTGEPFYVSKALNDMVNLRDIDGVELEEFTEAAELDTESEAE